MKTLFFAILAIAGIIPSLSAQTLTVNNFLPCSIVGVELYADDIGNCGSVRYIARLEFIEVAESISLDFTNPNSPTGSGVIRWTGGSGAWSGSPTGGINIIGARVYNPCGVTPGTCSATGNPYDEFTVWDPCFAAPSSGTFNFDVIGCTTLPFGYTVSFCDNCAMPTPQNATVTFTSAGGNWDVTAN